MAWANHRTYRLAKSDIQKALALPLIIAQDIGGFVQIGQLRAEYQRLGIKASAQRNALKFYELFLTEDEKLVFRRITDTDISEVHAYYLKRSGAGFFYDHMFSAMQSPAEVTNDKLKADIRELKANNLRLEGEVGELWASYEDVIEERDTFRAKSIDLSNRLTRAQIEASKFQKSFTEIIQGMLSKNEDDDTSGPAGATA